MVGETTNILSLAVNSQLLALNRTSRQIGAAQLRLATGNRVNSVTDNPQNFFESFSLSSRASNLSRALDDIGQGILKIQASESARNTLSNLVNLANTTAQGAKETLLADQQNLGDLIQADAPVVFYRLDETSGTTATNLGSGGAALNGTYQGGVSLDQGVLHFGEDNTSVRFDGTNDRIAIPNSPLINTAPVPERTVELVFQADDLTGRQVLYEEGGGTNAIALYLDNDRIYYAARDSGDFGPFDISTEVEAGVVYHAAFVLDAAGGTFTGYLNGEVVGVGAVTQPLSAHSGAVAIGRNAGGTFFHDGANAGNGEYFQGRIADFALYNAVLSQSDLQARVDATQLSQAAVFQQEVADIFTEIDSIVDDAGIQGVNLLVGNDFRTPLNEDGSSSLLTEGRDLSFSGLGLNDPLFNDFAGLENTLIELDDAVSAIDNFGQSLASDLNILQTRQSFTESTINNLEAGSEDLIRADQDEEAANLLALEARQDIQFATLALSAPSSSIADLLTRNPFGTF